MLNVNNQMYTSIDNYLIFLKNGKMSQIDEDGESMSNNFFVFYTPSYHPSDLVKFGHRTLNDPVHICRCMYKKQLKKNIKVFTSQDSGMGFCVFQLFLI